MHVCTERHGKERSSSFLRKKLGPTKVSTNRRTVKTLQNIHTMECHTAGRRNELQLHRVTMKSEKYNAKLKKIKIPKNVT